MGKVVHGSRLCCRRHLNRRSSAAPGELRNKDVRPPATKANAYNSIAPLSPPTASGHPMENTSSSKVRVAVVQAAPVMFDTQRSLQKLADFTADAAKSGAGLVVFPEAFIAGYPKGHDFGVSVGIRSTAGRDEFHQLFESAIDVPGASTDFIGTIAKDHGVHLVVGVIERDGGTLYCTAVMFAPDGGLLGKHRKVMPT